MRRRTNIRYLQLSTSSNAFPWASVRRSAEDRSLEAVISLPHGTINEALNASTNSAPEQNAETLNSSRLFLWIPVLLIFSRIGGMVRFFMDSYTMFNPAADRSALLRANVFFEIYQGMGDVSQPTLNLILVLILRPEARRFFVEKWQLLMQQLRKESVYCGREEEKRASGPSTQEDLE